MSKKPRIDTSSPSELRNNPFGALASALGDVPEAMPSEEAPSPVGQVDEGQEQLLRGKIVVRRQKKGRGGRTATLIEGIALDAVRLQELTGQLKKSLACGGTLEGSTIVLTGAQTERVRDWLQAHGATRVIVGN